MRAQSRPAHRWFYCHRTDDDAVEERRQRDRATALAAAVCKSELGIQPMQDESRRVIEMASSWHCETYSGSAIRSMLAERGHLFAHWGLHPRLPPPRSTPVVELTPFRHAARKLMAILKAAGFASEEMVASDALVEHVLARTPPIVVCDRELDPYVEHELALFNEALEQQRRERHALIRELLPPGVSDEAADEMLARNFRSSLFFGMEMKHDMARHARLTMLARRRAARETHAAIRIQRFASRRLYRPPHGKMFVRYARNIPRLDAQTSTATHTRIQLRRSLASTASGPLYLTRSFLDASFPLANSLRRRLACGPSMTARPSAPIDALNAVIAARSCQ
jgi:hypothetical protein